MTQLIKFPVLIPNKTGDGIIKSVSIDILCEWDEEIKEWLMTPEGHRLIDQTKLDHMLSEGVISRNKYDAEKIRLHLL